MLLARGCVGKHGRGATLPKQLPCARRACVYGCALESEQAQRQRADVPRHVERGSLLPHRPNFAKGRSANSFRFVCHERFRCLIQQQFSLL